MADTTETPEKAMSFLEHLDELRSRLFRSALVLIGAFAACWVFHEKILEVILAPIQKYLFEGGEIVYINITEPFAIYMKASAFVAIFVASPFLLYQVWAFVSPGLYKRERRLAVPFLVFRTLFFFAGGYFGYQVAVPVAARWLISLGGDYQANITLRSAFQFLSRIVLAMGLVFEMPVLIAFFSRMGLVTPAFLWRHFRTAVLVIAVVAAIVTPTGDVMTMSVFAGPMILLYLLGIGVSWFAARRDEE
jgi:sec-independent protein translocase protein TatC